jgi:SAM-dependent methyltransferase
MMAFEPDAVNSDRSDTIAKVQTRDQIPPAALSIANGKIIWFTDLSGENVRPHPFDARIKGNRGFVLILPPVNRAARARCRGARLGCRAVAGRGMRSTWDALAAGDTARYVGDPARGGEELDALLGRLEADPWGGVCVEIGCGPGRMTGALSERFDHVVAVDVSPAMLDRARAAVSAANVEFRPVSGGRLETVEDGAADVAVCYLVLQHLPSRAVVRSYLRELGRILRPGGEAFVQLPVLRPGLRPRAWRVARSLAVPVLERLSSDPERAAAFRGTRLTESELVEAVSAAGLRVGRRGTGPDAPYRHSRDAFLRLERPV